MKLIFEVKSSMFGCFYSKTKCLSVTVILDATLRFWSTVKLLL